MRIVILSDTHGHVEPFIQTLANEADLVIHAGDIGGLDILASVTPNRGELLPVRGNNDWPETWPGWHESGFCALEENAERDVPGGLIAIEHGHRIWDTKNYHKRLRAKHPNARAIVYGHTHIRCVDQSSNPWVLNPGAAGLERNKGGSSCISLEANEQSWQIIEYQSGEIKPSDLMFSGS